MADERTLVLVEDITFTDRLEVVARKQSGSMIGKDKAEQSAMFSFPFREQAHEFIYVARQMGHQASFQKGLFPGGYTPLDALREDAERIRRSLKKPMARPPWAQ